MVEIHKLDDGVEEYFLFSVLGSTYKFRYMTTDELMEFKKKMSENSEDFQKYAESFISKADDKSEDFTEVSKRMITPHWRKFAEMIISEFSA